MGGDGVSERIMTRIHNKHWAGFWSRETRDAYVEDAREKTGAKCVFPPLSAVAAANKRARALLPRWPRHRGGIEVVELQKKKIKPFSTHKIFNCFSIFSSTQSNAIYNGDARNTLSSTFTINIKYLRRRYDKIDKVNSVDTLNYILQNLRYVWV